MISKNQMKLPVVPQCSYFNLQVHTNWQISKGSTSKSSHRGSRDRGWRSSAPCVVEKHRVFVILQKVFPPAGDSVNSAAVSCSSDCHKTEPAGDSVNSAAVSCSSDCRTSSGQKDSHESINTALTTSKSRITEERS